MCPGKIRNYSEHQSDGIEEKTFEIKSSLRLSKEFLEIFAKKLCHNGGFEPTIFE